MGEEYKPFKRRSPLGCVRGSGYNGAVLLCSVVQLQWNKPSLYIRNLSVPFPPFISLSFFISDTFNPFRFYHFATNLLRLTITFFYKPLYSSYFGRSNNVSWPPAQATYFDSERRFSYLRIILPRQRFIQSIFRNAGTALSLSLSLSLSLCCLITSISKIEHWA